MNTEFRYFISAADGTLKEAYQLGLTGALKRFGVEQVILTTVEKNHQEDTFVIIAQSQALGVIGGIRVELKSEKNKLPIEKCSVNCRALIQERVSLLSSSGWIAEVCGLWVSPEAKGQGLGKRLAQEATELALGLGVYCIITMPPAHTFGYFASLGYVLDTQIPPLAYPDDRYISRVLIYYSPAQYVGKAQENLHLTSLDSAAATILDLDQ